MLREAVLEALPFSRDLWYSVYTWYVVLGTAAGVITFAIFGYILIKYRARSDGDLPPEEKLREDRNSWRGPLVVVALMAIVLLAVGLQTVRAINIYEAPPASAKPTVIRVTCHQFYFNFTYPNGQTLQNLLLVPADTPIILNVTSSDVYHQFGIPYFRLKTDAIPGRFNVVWFVAPSSLVGQNFTIQCFELCGVGHATMIARLSVISQAQFALFLGGGGV
jgi:cytochrome c oxidase subunit 2